MTTVTGLTVEQMEAQARDAEREAQHPSMRTPQAVAANASMGAGNGFIGASQVAQMVVDAVDVAVKETHALYHSHGLYLPGDHPEGEQARIDGNVARAEWSKQDDAVLNGTAGDQPAGSQASAGTADAGEGKEDSPSTNEPKAGAEGEKQGDEGKKEPEDDPCQCPYCPADQFGSRKGRNAHIRAKHPGKPVPGEV